MDIRKHLEILGFNGKDKVTGFEGVVSTVSFDLYGCIQVVLTPPIKEGKIMEGSWFDINRVKVTSDKPVMNIPNYEDGYVTTGEKGCLLKSVPKF